MVWKGDVSGSFTVKAYFNLLEGASPHKVPCKMLWNQHIPYKVGFLLGRCGGVRFLPQLS